MPKPESFAPAARRLLAWYDANARDLPWRVAPSPRGASNSTGAPAADPYAVWLSEIMLQQTTVATVAPRYAAFLKRWPTVAGMAAAPLDDVLQAWAGLGYYARARNLHKCARAVVEEHGGEFPDTEEALRGLPGIGPYTAAAIAAIAFDRPAVVVDGNVERVVSRLFAIATPPPAGKAEVKAAAARLWPAKRPGDFAQGLMDLGAMICTPTKPACLLCPLQEDCAAFHEGAPENYPVKPPKKPRPERRGTAYALFNARGEALFERRPEKGLLGGMPGLPGTAWSVEAPAPAPPAPAAGWRRAGSIEHVFTHFRLVLDVEAALAPAGFRRRRGQFWADPASIRLPTLMAKALDAALSVDPLAEL